MKRAQVRGAAGKHAGIGAANRAAYGAFALPLAMGALPLYVHLPKFYGEVYGLGLVTLGVLLLALRAVDAIADPLIGAWSDRGPPRKRLIAWSAPVLAFGMVALYTPPVRGETALLLWLGTALAIVYAAYSIATINHNAWGAELSADPVERTRITATREGLALCGVVVASVLPALLGGSEGEAAGLPRFAWVYAAIVALGLAVTLIAPAAPRPGTAPGSTLAGVREALADPLYRRLLAVYLVNGIAAAVPATLVLFYIADALQAEGRQGHFLALYFVSGAAFLPLWVRVSARAGKVRAWGASMIVAAAAFVWAALLGAGDVAAFAVVCVLSGAALGADLALPPSIVADVAGRHAKSRPTGAYFGVWTLATKLNLALAAGIALPLVSALGYEPGSRDDSALRALAIVYAALPCGLKVAALAALRTYAAAAAADAASPPRISPIRYPG